MTKTSTRRGFMKGGLTAGAALATAGLTAPARAEGDPAITEIQDWNRYSGPGVDASPYGKPSDFEAHVVRRNVAWLTADPVSSVNFTPLHELDGIITPNGLCFERHHAGVAEVDPQKHRLMINGLVDTPLVFTMADLMRFPRENHVYFLECAANSGMEWRGAQLNGCQYTHGMVHCVMYTGVKLKHLLEEAGVKTAGKWVMPEGADASAMTRSIPLEKALDDCLVAFKMNGEALRPEQGYPLRLVVPGWEGNMWVKWLRRLEVGDEPWHAREETSKYTDLLADGKARRFTWVMDVKSVITSPSPQMPITHGKGRTVLTGLAWSGTGRIARVDVSLDGGRNWVTARLDGPSLPKALHRFYHEFDWDGSELFLQSRAIDEAGFVQPTKPELRAVRGANSIYHNNGIQTWHVATDGVVENVEIS
ncbi:sulfite dehydrogenase [Nitratireductor pacificus]|uniref:Sulfite oxidase molybdopterin subunit n=1 Tax=Nitratireductor pacificus pht-3B TaxID=391937 RepID=K2M8P3_9HYPH|nr:sulfite dehydrogenase [Nitratireductor pacificus]EKF17370.1 sulfite oxidase molybdopterin subunit [Nitratireductor pacificus pht-3B]